MKVLITGRSGFIAQNLIHTLRAQKEHSIVTWSKSDGLKELGKHVESSEIIIHLASAITNYAEGLLLEENTKLDSFLSSRLRSTKNPVKLVFTSTTKLDNSEYSESKISSENLFFELNKSKNVEVFCLRLPAIFGKWSKPNHNSVVATYCYNAINNFDLIVDDDKKILKLIHIDDIVEKICECFEKSTFEKGLILINHKYEIKLNDLKRTIIKFVQINGALEAPVFESELTKNLYSTFKWFDQHYETTQVVGKSDERGSFFELLKMGVAGQVSYFTTEPGQKRGNHFHNTKIERFYILEGSVRFGFLDLKSDEKKFLEVHALNGNIEMVETTVGVLHELENIGLRQLKIICWANEVFDEENPDTFSL